MFGPLAQIVYVPLETEHRVLLKGECKNLWAFCERMKERLWPDWDEMCRTGSMHTQWRRT